ncbi:MAG: type IV pilus modification PilV family protein [Gemmatimonadaceae bacterium]
MSLLEALVALVILGLSVVGFLDVFQSGASSASRAADWAQTVAIAESAMEAATLGDALQAQQAIGAADERFARRVDVRPYRNDLSEVIVTVTSPRGSTFELHRLLRGTRYSLPGSVP